MRQKSDTPIFDSCWHVPAVVHDAVESFEVPGVGFLSVVGFLHHYFSLVLKKLTRALFLTRIYYGDHDHQNGHSLNR